MVLGEWLFHVPRIISHKDYRHVQVSQLYRSNKVDVSFEVFPPNRVKEKRRLAEQSANWHVISQALSRARMGPAEALVRKP